MQSYAKIRFVQIEIAVNTRRAPAEFSISMFIRIQREKSLSIRAFPHKIK